MTELEKEITDFMNIHKTSFSNHASRISDYFEMCCFNYIVKFYTERDYEISVQNLRDNKYRYKCSTQGNQENFSYFTVNREKKGVIHEFEIHHNIAIQSAHDVNVYTTPDISVVQKSSIEINEEFYSGSKKLSFVAYTNLVTFCEVKQFTPFPELMFNFIGIVNEIKPTHLNGTFTVFDTLHLAPSLMISGKPNDHALKIKESLEGRYCINIIYDLFSSTWHPFTTKRIRELRTITNRSRPHTFDELK